MRFLTPIALLVAALGLLYYFAKPHYEQIGTVRGQIQQYDDAIERAQQVVAKRNDLLSRRNSFSPTDIQRLETALPDSIDNIRLIIDMTNLASRYGSDLSGIGISKVDIQSQNTVGPNTKPYGTLTMNFGVSMTYDQFQQYLKDLERSLRIIDFNTLSVSPGDTSTGLYKFGLELTMYWLK